MQRGQIVFTLRPLSLIMQLYIPRSRNGTLRHLKSHVSTYALDHKIKTKEARTRPPFSVSALGGGRLAFRRASGASQQSHPTPQPATERPDPPDTTAPTRPTPQPAKGAQLVSPDTRSPEAIQPQARNPKPKRPKAQAPQPRQAQRAKASPAEGKRAQQRAGGVAGVGWGKRGGHRQAVSSSPF